MIRVIINGANGKMGKVATAAIVNQPDLTLVATTSRHDDLATAIRNHHADVVIDFTLPHCAFENTQTIIANNARPVIGTTGMTAAQIETLRQQCQQQTLGGIIAPSFSLAAILMMKYAQDAAKYLTNVEIIEMHHARKIDAPSGTAIKTAEMMAASMAQPQQASEHPSNARGEQHQGIPIHSVRLPGLFSHQAVIFGGDGETLTIRHDAMDRNAYMPGVFLACRKVMEIDHLVYGLEKFV